MNLIKLYMNKILIVIFVSLISINAQGLNTKPSSKQNIDDLLKKYNEYTLFNGSYLVAVKGKILTAGGVGFLNMELGIKNNENSKNRIGSITKQFTSMIIMKLYEQNKLKLSDNISDYLEYYREDTGSKISIENLLNHTSGIPNYTSFPGFMNKDALNEVEVDSFVVNYCSRDLEFEPGAEFNYSNSGYFILGAIIENITGQKYEEVLHSMILDPLGMNDSGIDHFGDILSNRATGYAKLFKGYKNAPYINMSAAYSAGAMYSTVTDLLKWDRALYTEDLITNETKKILYTTHIANYANGWFVVKSKNSENKETTSISHGGSINGFNSLIFRVIEDEILVVLLNNTGGAPLNSIKDNIINILRGDEYSNPKMSIAKFMYDKLETNSIDEIIKMYKTLKSEEPDAFSFSERGLNNLGYELLNSNKVKESIAIFKLNIDEHPKSSNVYDSMGEAFMMNGEKEKAIEFYNKSLEINPGNDNAKNMLKELGVFVMNDDPVVDPSILSKYQGFYKLNENFGIEITVVDSNIFAKATNQPKFEIFPKNELEFFYKVVNAQVKFNVEKSEVKSLTLFQAGREMEFIKTNK